MAVTDFSKVDSALRFLLDEAGVSAEAQKKIYDAGFDTLRSFACLDETSTAVRAALKQCGLDAEANLATRKDVALIVSAWESAKLQRTFEDKNKEEAGERSAPSGANYRICCHAGCSRKVSWQSQGQRSPK